MRSSGSTGIVRDTKRALNGRLIVFEELDVMSLCTLI